MTDLFEHIRDAQARLDRAVAANLSSLTCLRHWSAFIRIRDGNRCVVCQERKHLSAHHICRRSFLRKAQFETGNGITLCGSCHREVHEGFNGRPNPQLPMDTQGGEKINVLAGLFGSLVDDGRERGLLGDEFYYLSDSVLGTFKLLQGFEPLTQFPGCRLEQARLIWQQTPLPVRNAILTANGFPATTQPFRSGVTILFDD